MILLYMPFDLFLLVHHHHNTIINKLTINNHHHWRRSERLNVTAAWFFGNATGSFDYRSIAVLVLSMMMSNCPTPMLLIVCFGSSTVVFGWRLGGAGLVGERVRDLQFFFP